MSAVAIDNELMRATVAAIPADSLTRIRRSAVEQFVLDGFPTMQHEDWKYSNLSKLTDLSNTWLGVSDRTPVVTEIPAAIRAQLARLQASIDADWFLVSAGQIVSTDGAVARQMPQGLTIGRLADDVPSSVLFADDPMSRFNAALLTDGIRMQVQAGRVVDRPIGFLIVDSSARCPSVSQSRLIVDVEQNAHVSLIQAYWSGDGGAQFANAVTEVNLAKGGRADVVQIQECGNDGSLVTTLVVRQQHDSVFHYNSFDLGGTFTRNDVIVDILGAGADVNLSGLYLASNGQHIDNHTRVDHRVGPARSSEVYRGVLGHRSRCVFNGKAVVHAGADGTDAHQENHNLLLSEQAEIDTKPELEIYADDVKCSHGATVGQLDNAALFYLRTRGLTKDEAAIVLTRAFASSILSGLAIEACRDYVSQQIDSRLDTIISQNVDGLDS